MSKPTRPTSRDVARVAGVSRAAVSAVVNAAEGTIRVSPETRRRVLEAADQLGYSPDPFAQALRRQSSRLVGFVARSLQGSPYEQSLPVQLGIKIAEAARAVQHYVVHVDAAEFRPGGEELARFLLSQRVAGVVFDAPPTFEDVSAVMSEGLPVVQLMRPQFAASTAAVIVDPRPGVAAAIGHLVGMGHSRIAFVGPGGDHPVDRSRREAFLDQLAQRGIAAPDGYLCLVSDYVLAEGRRATMSLLAAPDPPTAIFAASDGLALGVLRALYELRVRVPEEISLLTYDDTIAAELYPPLSSISQPLRQVASSAIELLLERIDNSNEPPPPHLSLPTSFVTRASTGPPPATATGAGR